MPEQHLPADWAVKKAVERAYTGNGSKPAIFDSIKRQPSLWSSYVELARMIEKHEERPADKYLSGARQYHAESYGRNSNVGKRYLSGQYDEMSGINRMAQFLKDWEKEHA